MVPQLPLANMSLPAKVLEHVALSNTVLVKAAAAEKQAMEQAAAIDKLVPGVVDALIQHSRIRPDQREKVAQCLHDPVQVLQLMQKLAGHRNDAEAARLGTPVAQKTAGTKAANSPYVGGRSSDSHVSESTAALFRGLGLAAPNS